MMNTFSPSSAAATEAFEVTREVLLESNRAPQVRALTQTKEGGYVIAGSDQHIPWATRTDAEGHVQWRHVLPMKEWTPGGTDAHYESAAAMTDDSTLLCGYKGEGEELHPPILGLLTHIDKAGKMLSHRVLYPQGDKSFALNYLRQCVPWDDGFAVVGDASRWVSGAMQRFLWLLALDANGDVKWEKLIPNITPSIRAQAMVTPKQDLLLLAMNQIVLLDTNGTIKSQKTVGQPADQFVLVRPVVPDSVARVFPAFNDPASTLQNFGESLEDLGQVRGPAGGISSNRAYLLPDRSLVLFGDQRENSTPTASMVKLSADLATRQTFLHQPLWIAGQINDALPTGKPSEFVTIRLVHPLPSWNETRLGLLMAFVRVK